MTQKTGAIIQIISEDDVTDSRDVLAQIEFNGLFLIMTWDNPRGRACTHE